MNIPKITGINVVSAYEGSKKTENTPNKSFGADNNSENQILKDLNNLAIAGKSSINFKGKDDNNDVITTICKTPDGRLKYTIETSGNKEVITDYDDDGNVEEKKVSIKIGKSKTIMTLDGNGNLLKKEVVSVDD